MDVVEMVKEECISKASEALAMREGLINLANDITNESVRRGRYDPSGFIFVARSYSARLLEKGFTRASDLMSDAALHYPATVDDFPDKSMVDIMEAKRRIERKMFEDFCGCEK